MKTLLNEKTLGCDFDENTIEEKDQLSIFGKIDLFIHGDDNYLTDVYTAGFKYAKCYMYKVIREKNERNFEEDKKCDFSKVEDIAQVSIIKVLNAKDTIKHSKAFWSILRTTSYHTYLDMINKHDKDLSIDATYDTGDDKVVIEFEDKKGNNNPEIACFNIEQREWVQIALEALKKEEKDVLVMNFYHDKTLKEIAEEMGLKMSTIQGRFQQGKKHLAQEIIAMTNEGVFDSDLISFKKF